MNTASKSESPAPADDAASASPEEIHLDVRPLIASGEEPFGAIMNAVARVAPGGFFVLDAPFDPAPLRRLLAKKGFSHELSWLAEDHCRVTFRRDRDQVAEARTDVTTDAIGARIWRQSAETHIDVRGLEPPNPMTAILRLLAEPSCTRTVIVHHDREPIFLYPELTERGWSYEVLRAEGGETRLRLSRGGP